MSFRCPKCGRTSFHIEKLDEDTFLIKCWASKECTFEQKVTKGEFNPMHCGNCDHIFFLERGNINDIEKCPFCSYNWEDM